MNESIEAPTRVSSIGNAVPSTRTFAQTDNERSAEPRRDEAYCRTCASVIKRAAVVCVHCGVPTADGSPRAAAYASGRAGLGEGKSKTAAIVLAVFVGIFTWLYTYREDASKFWISASVSLVNVVLTFLTLGLWLFIAFPVGIGLWVWTIVDTATKKDDWYAGY